MNDGIKRDTAFHEAGHAVMGCLLGRPPISADIYPDESGNVGHTNFENDAPECAKGYLDQSDEKRRYLEVRVLTVLAGTASHNIHSPNRTTDTGDEFDLKTALEFVNDHMSWVENRDEYLQQSMLLAGHKLHSAWDIVIRVANALLDRGHLSREEILALLN